MSAVFHWVSYTSPLLHLCFHYIRKHYYNNAQMKLAIIAAVLCKYLLLYSYVESSSPCGSHGESKRIVGTFHFLIIHDWCSGLLVRPADILGEYPFLRQKGPRLVNTATTNNVYWIIARGLCPPFL